MQKIAQNAMIMQDGGEKDDQSTIGAQPVGGEARHSPPPLQFGISSLLWIMLAVALIFSTLRWLQVPPATSLIILALLAASALAVVVLVAAISKVEDDEP
jgi:hypothetical protein